MKKVFIFCLIFSALFLNAYTQDWPHKTHKIKPDPATIFGECKNGFRYILKKNTTPEKKVYVNLLVKTGSLCEVDGTEGIAHFLEHMAFNGTKNFPGNSIIEYFKKIGMNFGGDTNASTTFDKTIYKLILPDESHMDDGLTIMNDYANYIEFSPEEIDKERGIILSEKRSRDTIEYRIMLKNFQFSLPNSLITKRFPIGTEDTINSVKQDDFLKFYQEYYQPQNMVLFVVGDIDEKKWEKAIKKIFKEKPKNISDKTVPPIAPYTHEGVKINYIYEKDAPETSVDISTLTVIEKKDEPYFTRLENSIADAAGVYILNQRLKEIYSKQGSPIRSANASLFRWMEQIESGGISANCKPENWQEALIIIENELRKIITYGVSEQEVSLFKADYSKTLKNAEDSMKTQSSSSILNQLLSTLEANNPYLNPSQTRDLQEPFIQKLTPEKIMTRFQYYWNPSHRLISVTGNAEIDDALNSIGKAYTEASLIKLEKPQDKAIAQFPYESYSDNLGKVAKANKEKDLNIETITFENNVVFNYKPTDFQQDQILIRINLGEGASTLPKEKLAMYHLVAAFINEGGLKRLRKIELQKALTGKNANVQFSLDPTDLAINCRTNTADLETALQLARAFLLEPGFHDEAQEITQKWLETQYENIKSNIMFYYQINANRILTNNHPFISLPEKENLLKINIEEVKDWVTNQLKDCSIEINIVGDFKEKDTNVMVAKYFGSLPKRQEIKKLSPQQVELQKGISKTEEFPSKIKGAIVGAFAPTVDYRNISEVRKLNLFSYAVNEKTRKVIREEMALAYSPSTSHVFNKEYKDFCYLRFIANVEPNNVERANQAFKMILTETLQNGITKDELEDVRKPLLNNIKPYMRKNHFWLDQVLSGMTRNPYQLDNARTLFGDYEKLSVEEINEAAKKYIKMEQLSFYNVKSEGEEKTETK